MTGETRAATLLLEFMSYILFIFGTGGMALAGLGIYGLVSYSARQSTHEIGIRMALGADARAVVRDFLGRGLRLGAMGAALGLVLAAGVSRLLASVLFGVPANQLPAVFPNIATFGTADLGFMG